MKRLMALINGILPFFAAIFIESSLMSIIEIWYNKKTGIEQLPPGVDYYIAVISVTLCGLIFFYWYTKTLQFQRKVFPKQVFKVRAILLLLGLGIASQLTISGLMSLIEPLFKELFRDYGQIVESIMGSDIVIVILYVTLIAPITEELIFRGVMFNKLQEALPFFAANILQAAVFAVFHWNIIQGIYAFGLGLLLGYVTYRFRSLTASILLHMAVNSAAFLIGLLPDTRMVYALMLLIGGMGILYLLKMIGRNKEI